MSASSFRCVLHLGAAWVLVGCASGGSEKGPGSSGGSTAVSRSVSIGDGGSSVSGGVSSSFGGSPTANSRGGTNIGSSAGNLTSSGTSSSGGVSGRGGNTTGSTGMSASGSGVTGGIASGGSRADDKSVSSSATTIGGATSSSSAGASGGTPASSSAAGGARTSGGITGSSGANSSGGTSGSGGSTASGGTSATPFVLDWEDNFDSFDSAKWTLQTHTWEGNLAQFSTQNTKVASGILSINLTRETGDAAKPYRGVEMRSLKTLTYGKISARIRFAKGSGVVSGLVAIYTPWPAGDWNEIDIEHLGKTPTAVQLNCMVYPGTPVANPTTSVTPTQDPQIASLGFDAEAGFHQYDVEWTPTGVKFIIDGTVQRTWSAQIARMKLPQNILFTIWASSSTDWAGAVSSATIPTSADIDWIKVYSWKG